MGPFRVYEALYFSIGKLDYDDDDDNYDDEFSVLYIYFTKCKLMGLSYAVTVHTLFI